MNRRTMVLKKSIIVGETGAPITELHFRAEVVAGDLRGIRVRDLDNPPLDAVLTIAGRLCGQPDVVMNKLSHVDLGALLEIVGGFLSPAPATGTAPSQS